MPQYIPPSTTVPADWKQEQHQNQNQNADAYVTNNDYSSQESESNADNRNNLNGSLSNVQINNNNTGTYQYEYGVKIPSTTLTIGGWANENDHGAQIMVTIPLGGGNRKLAKRQVNTRVRQMEIENRARTLKVCDNLWAGGYEILDYEGLGLADCQQIRKVAQTPVQNAKDETQALLDTIQKQQAMINALMQRLDQMNTNNGGSFKTRG